MADEYTLGFVVMLFKRENGRQNLVQHAELNLSGKLAVIGESDFLTAISLANGIIEAEAARLMETELVLDAVLGGMPPKGGVQ